MTEQPQKPDFVLETDTYIKEFIYNTLVPVEVVQLYAADCIERLLWRQESFVPMCEAAWDLISDYRELLQEENLAAIRSRNSYKWYKQLEDKYLKMSHSELLFYHLLHHQDQRHAAYWVWAHAQSHPQETEVTWYHERLIMWQEVINITTRYWLVYEEPKILKEMGMPINITPIWKVAKDELSRS